MSATTERPATTTVNDRRGRGSNRRSWAHLRSLEGRQVSVALSDGSRIDDCQLVSAGRRPSQRLWFFVNGIDVFLPPADVVAIWEAPSARRPAAA
jgi:hypothetical protein